MRTYAHTRAHTHTQCPWQIKDHPYKLYIPLQNGHRGNKMIMAANTILLQSSRSDDEKGGDGANLKGFS